MNHTIHSDTADVPTFDTILELLSDHRRRQIVRLLADRDEPLDLRDLAAAIACEDADGRPADTTDEIVTSLHYNHLPRLDDANVITYDTHLRYRDKVLAPTRIEALTPYLDPPDDG